MKSLETLIPKIILKTNEGSIIWAVDFGDDRFIAKVGTFYVSIWSWFDEEDGTQGLTAVLKRNKTDKEYIDMITFDTYSSKYHEIRDLHVVARRSALGINKIIDELENELDNL